MLLCICNEKYASRHGWNKHVSQISSHVNSYINFIGLDADNISSIKIKLNEMSFSINNLYQWLVKNNRDHIQVILMDLTLNIEMSRIVDYASDEFLCWHAANSVDGFIVLLKHWSDLVNNAAEIPLHDWMSKPKSDSSDEILKDHKLRFSDFSFGKHRISVIDALLVQLSICGISENFSVPYTRFATDRVPMGIVTMPHITLSSGMDRIMTSAPTVATIVYRPIENVVYIVPLEYLGDVVERPDVLRLLEMADLLENTYPGFVNTAILEFCDPSGNSV